MTLDKKIFDNLIEQGKQKERKEYNADAAENQRLNLLLKNKQATYEAIKDKDGKTIREIVKDQNGNVIYDEIPWDKEKLQEERFLKDIAKSDKTNA